MAKKIFIADDSPETLELAEETLSSLGYEVTAWETGRGALAKIKDVKPDLVILDAVLTGVDGLSLAGQVSEDQSLKNVPILVITAFERAKPLFGKNSRVKDFCTKPFTAEELARSVEAALS